jgi:hypothetical protein
VLTIASTIESADASEDPLRPRCRSATSPDFVEEGEQWSSLPQLAGGDVEERDRGALRSGKRLPTRQSPGPQGPGLCCFEVSVPTGDGRCSP